MITVLEIKSLYKNYGGKTVLNGISFTVEKGEIVSLSGRNGSGKTTTFKSILSLTDYEGRIRMNGKIIDKKRTGYLPEQRSLFSDSTVHRQLLMAGRLKGCIDKELESRLKQWYERTGTEQYRDMYPGNLSKGNQQKIQLIMALIHDPDLLIMDEPWTGLDQDNARLFRDILLELKTKKKTILLSSHQYQQVQEICDRYLYLQDGNIILNISRNQLENSRYCIVETHRQLESVPEGTVIETEGIRKTAVPYRKLAAVISEFEGKESIRDLTVRKMTFSDLVEIETCGN